MERLRLLGLVGLVVVASFACSANRKLDANHRVIEHYFPVDLSDTPSDVHVACPAGEVLLGAGYAIDRATLDLENAVAVEANHPDGPNGWHLAVVRQPDSAPYEVSASLYLYCLVRTDGNPMTVSAQTVTGGATSLARHSNGIATGTGTAVCPGAQKLTSGGFAVELSVPDPTAAAYNSWIWSSVPAPDRQSWSSQAAFIENGDDLPSLRAYAHCVSDPDNILRPSNAPDIATSREGGFNFDFYQGIAPCGSGALATGGGFFFGGDQLVPHSILRNQTSSDLAGWRVRGVFGFQTGTTGGLTDRPICFESLEIEKPLQPDLKPLIGTGPLQTTGCPNGAPLCFTFTVLNAGTAPSPASEAEFGAGAGGSARTAVPGLAPSESTEITMAVPNPCTTDCSATITVDPDHAIAESNEANNVAEWSAVG